MDMFFFFSSRRRHTRYWRDWSSDVCSSDLKPEEVSEAHCNHPAGHEDDPQETGYALPDLKQPRPPGVGRIVDLRQPTFVEHLLGFGARSEERRVGKECRSRWSPYH